MCKRDGSMNARMKLFVFLWGLISTTAFAGTKDPSKYPLRVHILLLELTTTTRTAGGLLQKSYQASGNGNIEDGNSWRGFDYTLECLAQPYLTTGSFAFMGKWRKPETRLVIVIPEIGDPKNQEECELKTTLRDVVYAAQSGAVVTYTPEQYARMSAIQKALDLISHPQGGGTPLPPTGTWEAQGVPYAPWVLNLRAEGNTLIGIVRQAQFDLPNGGKTALTNPAPIYDGTIQGNTVSFKCDSPGGGDRIVTFTGVINGDVIDFTRAVRVRPGGDPGRDGIFGASGAAHFTAKRDPIFE
jgi:hypothetical protein